METMENTKPRVRDFFSTLFVVLGGSNVSDKNSDELNKEIAKIEQEQDSKQIESLVSSLSNKKRINKKEATRKIIANSQENTRVSKADKNIIINENELIK